MFTALFLLLSTAVPYTIYTELDGRFPLGAERLWSAPLVLGCVALLTVYYCSDGLRLFFVLKALGYAIPRRRLAPLVFINLLVSNLTPMATGGGLAQVWYLRREGVHVGAATAATTLRTLLASAMIFVPAPFLFLFLDALKRNPLHGHWTFFLGAAAALYVGFFTLLLLRRGWFIHLLDLILRLLHRLHLIGAPRLRRWRFGLRREMIRFTVALRAFRKGPRQAVLLALLFSLLFLLSLFSFPALLLWSLGYAIDYATVLGLMTVTTFIMYFAPTPGAAGIAEGAFGLLFAKLVGQADLVLVILAWRFLTIHLGMLIGVPLSLHTLARRNTNA
ncbi:lysylphosphatidylglycerol synthase transmembrane domain-containing protein [Motiliproteus sp. SC1-56]|uniref:lysylphosphatidylglycerol synthase transmembrane domain-containing protein n=1 Tax=Motiliproteus sp. SC1-56 TaxID=2799565 RepID=UPI001A90BDE5|nr:lysylphosphatidylglycerol synthase transmembrane domain-containing protein [Motiliproteus sp. SC1-56]